MRSSSINFKDSSGGALLFAMVTAFLVSMLAGTLILFTASQYKMVNSEVQRKESLYLLRAGMEFANYKLRSGEMTFQEDETEKTIVPPSDLIDKDPNLEIKVIRLAAGEISDYKIQVNTSY